MKTRICTVITVLTLFGCALLLHAQPTRVDWDRHATHNSNTVYALKYGVVGQPLTNRFIAGTNTVSLTLSNGPWGALEFQSVAVAFGTNGTNAVSVESDPSNKVTLTNRPAAPLRLRIVEQTETVQIEGSVNGGATWKTLATVTNEPAVILGSMQSMLFRARTIKPPPLP